MLPVKVSIKVHSLMLTWTQFKCCYYSNYSNWHFTSGKTVIFGIVACLIFTPNVWLLVINNQYLKPYLLTPPLSPPQSEELFLLPGDEINPGVFQQRSKHKEQTHGHPDINGLHVGDLQRHRTHRVTWQHTPDVKDLIGTNTDLYILYSVHLNSSSPHLIVLNVLTETMWFIYPTLTRKEKQPKFCPELFLITPSSRPNFNRSPGAH